MIIESTKERAEELSLPHSEKSRFMSLIIGGGEVIVSYSKYGDTLDCHIAANRQGKRLLRVATKSIAKALFLLYPEINKITATITKNSVTNLVKKCGFTQIAIADTSSNGAVEKAVIMALWREEAEHYE